MRLIKSLLPVIFVLSLPAIGFSQTMKTIDSLETAHQHCLDDVKYSMLRCEKYFYAQMDSLLNVVYWRLYDNLNTSQKADFKKEQKLCLLSRDAYFKKTLKTFKDKNPDVSPYGSAFGAQDDAMLMYSDNTSFVEDRVIELIKKAEHINQQ